MRRNSTGRCSTALVKNYGIELQWRPVKKPLYGGHIQRWLGTFAQELQNLPGATFSNPAERGVAPIQKIRIHQPQRTTAGTWMNDG
jgi:hypothetical protein